MRKVNIEKNQALVDLCLNCERPKCVGGKGCKEYLRLAADISDKQNFGEGTFAILPAEPECIPVSDGKAEKSLLMHCNAAIEELNSILRCESMNMCIPEDVIQNCVTELKSARVHAYGHLVDWDAVARSMGGN